MCRGRRNLTNENVMNEQGRRKLASENVMNEQWKKKADQREYGE
jgi:hypothetical protein